MGYTFDNQTLLYIIIFLFIGNIILCRYYVNSSIENSQKKTIKKINKTITATFDQYTAKPEPVKPQYQPMPSRKQEDSLDDPADDIEDT
jgi:hypothetical protein